MPDGLDLGRRLRRLRGHGLRMTQENTPRGSKLYIAAMPVEKPYAEFSLQIRDLLA
jgi:hypothetical protein